MGQSAGDPKACALPFFIGKMLGFGFLMQVCLILILPL